MGTGLRSCSYSDCGNLLPDHEILVSYIVLEQGDFVLQLTQHSEDIVVPKPQSALSGSGIDR